MLLVVVVSRYVFGEEAAETLLVGVESLNALAGKTADAAGGRTGAALVNLQVTSLLQRLDLDAQIAASGVGNLAEVHDFANAVTSAAVEARTEGLVLGVGTKIFTIAGPVLLYGTAASAVYGLIYWLMNNL